MSLGNPFLYALMFEGGGEEAVTPEAEEEEGTERAPLCDECGHVMVRYGPLYRCLNCDNVDGYL